MHRPPKHPPLLSALLYHLCSLRALVALVALWLLLRGPLPEWMPRLQEQLQSHLFRLGLHLSELPAPQTPITVIHVPDIEYERWLVDLPGAASLDQILAMGGEDTVYGLVLERPLVLIQPAAESLLHEIQLGRRARDPLARDVTELLARRESLVAALKSSRLVLGLTDQSSHLFQPIPVQESFSHYPQFLRSWLWPWPDAPAATVVSPGFQYYPVDSTIRQQQRLALLDERRALPTFPLKFWAVASRLSQGRPADELLWRRDTGFSLGVAHIATSTSAEIAPLYGPISGIRASMRQITLGAALGQEKLSGWVLLGRDSSPVLEQTAQLIASLGDRAYMVEPPWWSAVHKSLLLALALYLLIGAPRLPMPWVFGTSLAWLCAIVGVQLVGQVWRHVWLPVGDLLGFGGFGLASMLLWRWQNRAWLAVHDRADRASLALAELDLARGELRSALQRLQHCRTSEALLDCLRRIADAGELAGDYENALAALQMSRRRRWRQAEVITRIKTLRSYLLYQRQKAQEGEPALPVADPVG